MTGLINLWEQLTARLRGAGESIPPLFLRLILAYEFYDSGVTKLNGSNWFANVKDNFPFPFNSISADISWFMATWFEVIGGIALAVGLFTRFFAISLVVITAVATAAVHWPAEWNSLGELWQGYAISDKGFGNFKLPLLFLIMLLPLVFNGAGKLSLDHLLSRFLAGPDAAPAVTDLTSLALALAVLGVALIFVMPIVGTTLLGLAVLTGLAKRFMLG